MSWFKKKVPVETFVADIIHSKLPSAEQFFEKENARSHNPLKFNRTQLLEIGAGMALFFLGKFFPDTEKKNLDMMARAFKQVEKSLPELEADPVNAYTWWKAFTDGLIFQDDGNRLRMACRIVWEKNIPDLTYREPSPLRAYGYIIEMEVNAAEKIALT